MAWNSLQGELKNENVEILRKFLLLLATLKRS